MNNLKREMKQVWTYVNDHPGCFTPDIVRAFEKTWNSWHTYMLLEALQTDSYIRSEPSESMAGGIFYWSVRIFS